MAIVDRQTAAKSSKCHLCGLANTRLSPFETVYVRLYTGILSNATTCFIFPHHMNTPKKRLTGFAVNIHILLVWRNVGNYENLIFIGSAGLDKFNDFISISALALPCIWQFAAFFEGIRKIDTFVQMTARVLVGIRAVRLLVKLIPVLEET